MVVPNNIFDRWMERFERKYRQVMVLSLDLFYIHKLSILPSHFIQSFIPGSKFYDETINIID